MVRMLTIPVGKGAPETDDPGGTAQNAPQDNGWTPIGEAPMEGFNGTEATVQQAGFTNLLEKLSGGKAVVPEIPVRPPVGLPGGAPPISARHASPHDFNQFNWQENLSRGEGGQMITPGTYLSTSPGVHQNYTNKFGGPKTAPEEFFRGDLEKLDRHIESYRQALADPIVALPHNAHIRRAYEKNVADWTAERARRVALAEKGEWGEVGYRPGATQYDVNVYARPEELLDWGKPLSEQPGIMQRIPQPVLEAIEEAADARGINGPLSAPEAWSGRELVRALERHDVQELLPDTIPLPGGKKASSWTEGDITNEKIHTVAFLNSLGIKGVRYPSVGGKNDTMPNYVVFDDKLIEIVKKYGLAGALGGGALAVAGKPGEAQAQTAGGWNVVNEAPADGGWTVQSEAPAPSRGGVPEAAGAAPSPSSAPAVQAPWMNRDALPPVAQQEAVLTPGKTPLERVVGSIPNPRNIPQRVAEDFRSGASAAMDPNKTAIERVLGIIGAGFSGVSGTGKALIRDPMLEATGDLNKANQAEMLGGAAITPGGAIRSLPGIAGNYRAGDALRSALPAAPAAPMAAAPAARVEPPMLPPPGAPPPAAPPVPMAGGGARPPAPPAGGPPSLPPGEVPPGAGAGSSGFPRATEFGEVVDPVSRPLSEAERKLLEGLGKYKPKLPTTQEAADAAVTNLVDDLYPFRVFDREAEKVRRPGEATIHEMARLTRGSPGGASHAIRYGTYDYRTRQVNGPGLAQIVKGYDRAKLTAYMLAERTLELERRGMAAGFDVEAARKVVQESGQRYARVFQEVKAYQDRVLQYYADSGFISADGIKMIRELNQEYIPLKRVLEEMTSGGSGKNLQTWQAVKSIKGTSEYKTLDPLETMVQNTYTMLSLAERNRAKSEFVERATRLARAGGPNILEPKNRALTVPGAPPSAGGKPLLEGPIKKADEELTRTAAYVRRTFRPGNDTFTVFRNGRPVHYKTTPQIAKAIEGLGETELNMFWNILAAPARALRVGVTSDPYYLISNVINDQYHAAAQSASGFRPYLDWISGAKSIIRKDDQYKALLRHGGSQASRAAQNYAPMVADLNLVKHDSGVARRVLGAAKAPVTLLEKAKEIGEQATHVGEFKRAMRLIAKERALAEGTAAPGGQAARGSIPEGINATDLDRAAFRARNVTADFAAHGRLTAQYNAITSFLGGTIQGQFRELQSLKNRPAQVAGVTAAMVAFPSVLNWYFNHNDPRYADAPEYVRDRYFMLLPSDPLAEPVLIKRPPSVVGSIGSAIERALDKAFTENPEAFKGFGKHLSAMAIPPVLPNFAQPPLEIWANKSGFRDAPLVGRGQERLEPEERGTRGTSEFSRRVGQAFGVTPQYVDNIIQGYTGTVGTSVSHMPDSVLRPAHRGEMPERPWTQSPFLRRLYGQNIGTKPISDFYDNAKKLEMARATYRKLSAENRDEEADKKSEEVHTAYSKAMKQMSDYFAQIRAIETDREMPGKEKREQIMEITRMQVEAAKEFNQVYHTNAKALQEKRSGSLDPSMDVP